MSVVFAVYAISEQTREVFVNELHQAFLWTESRRPYVNILVLKCFCLQGNSASTTIRINVNYG